MRANNSQKFRCMWAHRCTEQQKLIMRWEPTKIATTQCSGWYQVFPSQNWPSQIWRIATWKDIIHFIFFSTFHFHSVDYAIQSTTQHSTIYYPEEGYERNLLLHVHCGGSNLNVINASVQIELEFQWITTTARSFNTLNCLHSDCVKHKSIPYKRNDSNAKTTTELSCMENANSSPSYKICWKSKGHSLEYMLRTTFIVSG
jgi:hypothetical protein